MLSVNGEAAPAVVSAAPKDNRFEYVRGDGLTEWYVNDERGLEQGFVLSPKMEGEKTAVLDLGICGDLRGGMTPDGEVVEFLNREGVGIIHFGGLKAWDAAGRPLSGCMEMVDGGVLRVSVDVGGAVYPVTIDPIATSAAWTAESNQNTGTFGYSVATAGDVNGDGYSDVIVGAPLYDGAQADGGAAFVYLGSSSGLGSSASWSVTGDQTGAQFGNSVATIGDVNADGYDDVIVGAVTYDVDSDAVGEGKVFAYFGSSSGPSATESWTALGGMDNEAFGRSVATAGDVNDDGYSDVIIGASGYTNVEVNEGRACVYHGSEAGLAASPDWAYEGTSTGASFGWVVATAGDVNGDGYSDALVTAYSYTSGELNEGAAFVFHGGAAGLSATVSWTVQSNLAGAFYGTAAGTAGDVNGDGYADVIVGAPQYNAGFAGEGMIFVYHGSNTGLAATPNFRVRGNVAGMNLGSAVGTAGDANGDGYADIVVGAMNYTGIATIEANEGAVMGWFGSSVGLYATPPQASPDFWTTRDWIVESNQAGANMGYSVAAAGDVNGDGYSDVIAGALNYSNPDPNEGRVFVYYGSVSAALSTVNWRLDPTNEASANYGFSVASAGDVNGDGYSDVIVGAPYYDGTPVIADQGAAYVYFGSSSGPSTSVSWARLGGQAGALYGFSVAGIGDVNGDGYGDVAVGAPGYSSGHAGEGWVMIYHGSAAGLSGAVRNLELNRAGAAFGTSVAAAGDVNGDGCGDLVVGAPSFSDGGANAGFVALFFGRPGGLINATASWYFVSYLAGEMQGCSVAGAGDVNGDGYDDIVVGAKGSSNGGMAYVYLGGGSGPGALPDWTGNCGQAGALYGSSVATAGDVNGDNFSDIIVGAPGYTNTLTGEGRAYVYYGSGTGIGATPWAANGGLANAAFGYSVCSAGDMNGDGLSDVAIGAPRAQITFVDEGRVLVYRGSLTGVGTTLFSVRGTATSVRFGYCVANAGDTNGDGYSDLMLGVPFYQPAAPTSEGRAYVYYGNAESGGVGLAVKPRQTKIGGLPLGPECKSDSTTSARIVIAGRTPYGRAKAAMEVEVKPVGVSFDGSDLRRSTGWTDTTVTGADIERIRGNLAPSTRYHWRARLLYQSAKVPFQERSRWFTLPWNASTENDFRTATPPNAPSDPGATGITTSLITWTWKDNSTDESGFKVWADVGSADPLVQQALTAAGVTSLVYGGLQTNTQYSFRVAAAASVGDSDKTAIFSAYTAAAIPTAPTVSNPTGTSLDVEIGAADGNPPHTLYAVQVTPLVGGNSWLQADGSIGADAVYQTAADWAVRTVNGLAGGTTYGFSAIARNGDGLNSAAGPPGTGSTLDTVPPTGSIDINTGAVYTSVPDVTLILVADDAGGSGVTDMRFSEDNATWGGWVAFAATQTYTLSGGDGTKTVYVQFRDADGNVSTVDISDSIILETGIPTGTISINSGLPCTALDAVSLSLSADDAGGSGVTDMQFSEDGVSWSVWEVFNTSKSFTLSGGDGLKTVYVKYRDLAGNESVPASASVSQDTTAPSGTLVINGGAAVTSSADVSLSLTADDGTGCGGIQMRFSEDGATWTAWEPFATPRAFTLSGPDGPKTVMMELKDVMDNAMAVPVTASIALDTTEPAGTVVIDGGAPYATSTSVSLTILADDGSGSGVVDMRFSDDGVTWTAWEAYATTRAYSLSGADGSKSVYVEFRDVVGLVSVLPAQDDIMLDQNAPTGSVVVDADAAYATTAAVTLTLSTDDGTGSGVTDMRFSEDGSNWTAWQTYSASSPFTLTGADGTKTVYAEFRDGAGLVTSPAVQDSILLDQNAPTGSLEINAGALYTTDGAVTLGMTADDGTGSGVADMRFSEDGATWTAWETWASTKAYTLSGADGLKHVYAEFRDAAGNVSAIPEEAGITLDTQAPAGTIAINSGAAYATSATVTLDLTADDGSGSGVADMRFGEDGTTWGAWEPYGVSSTFTLTGTDGLKTVYAEYRDAAGQVSAVVSDTITLDTAAPAATITRLDASPTVSTVVRYTVAFSEPVMPALSPAAIVVTGALAATVEVSGSGPYTVTLTVTTLNADGLLGMEIAPGVTDEAGNPLGAASGEQYDIVNWPGFASEPHDADLYTGDAHSVGVTVNPGARTPSYQWKFNGGTVTNGPTTQSWNLGAITLSQGGSYWCEVNYGGVVVSTTPAVLRVRDRISITSPPVGDTVLLGGTYQFAVTATGGYAPLAYQWKRDGENILGAESNTYTINDADQLDGGVYTVEIRDANTDVIESAPATLVVEKGTPVAGWLALTALAVGMASLGMRRGKR